MLRPDSGFPAALGLAGANWLLAACAVVSPERLVGVDPAAGRDDTEVAPLRAVIAAAATRAESAGTFILAAAVYALETACAEEEIKCVTMAEAIGLAPGTQLELERFPIEALPAALAEPVGANVARPLADRPDLLAKAALVEARAAESRRARAARLPKIGGSGVASWNQLGNSIPCLPGLEELDFGLQTYAGLIGVQWPLFDDFVGANTKNFAAAQRQAAKDELGQAPAEACRAPITEREALARRRAAEAMVAAADAAFVSTFESFRHGQIDMPTLELARARRAEALRARAESGAAVLGGFARLALGTGQMGPGFLAPQSGELKHGF